MTQPAPASLLGLSLPASVDFAPDAPNQRAPYRTACGSAQNKHLLPTPINTRWAAPLTVGGRTTPKKKKKNQIKNCIAIAHAPRLQHLYPATRRHMHPASYSSEPQQTPPTANVFRRGFLPFACPVKRTIGHTSSADRSESLYAV
ncbi:hypothetical protein CCM_06185 [Cordyceps militaris CM01]|uniref:Uncharacterized protein n=1 Tax=Cordyceps militaris (strain CM01) TaxID=983644 RepID=G3JJ83_CORMM|nr:uncharacterized protein CCM_06185 [Cordyceps militaris CM01]EGX92025.1 hypothetical protein CCM_06185 [Cordyceps militaris CM01]